MKEGFETRNEAAGKKVSYTHGLKINEEKYDYVSSHLIALAFTDLKDGF